MNQAPPASTALKIGALFAVPFGSAHMSDPAALNRELCEIFLAKEKFGKEYTNPNPLTQRNPAVFESRFDLFKWPDAPIQRLKDFCWAHLMNFVGELNGYDPAKRHQLLIYSDAWFHITRRGGFFGLHNHANATWSGVYCVDPGRHDANHPESGELCMVNPFIQSAMYLDVSTQSLRVPFDHNLRSFRLEPGQLLLFPSWLLHDVKPFAGEGERVTVAFNCWFAPPADGSPG
jgi:uncharacterized protein (TIGR02466 family)